MMMNYRNRENLGVFEANMQLVFVVMGIFVVLMHNMEWNALIYEAMAALIVMSALVFVSNDSTRFRQ